MKKLINLLIIVGTLSCNSKTNQENQLNKLEDSSPIKPANSKPNLVYKKYCNGRFDYCIDYPSEILFPQPEPTNGDGCAFKNKQAEEILSVVGYYPYEEEGIDPLASAFESELAGEFEDGGNNGRVIAYKKLGKAFFVVSGYKNGKVFYHKTILKGNVLASARLQYAETERDIYDNVSERLFQSFK